VLSETLVALETHTQRLARGDAAAVLARWRELAPLAVGSTVEWDRDGVRMRGTTAGIDRDGALLVRAAGAPHRIVSAEVRWI
jgi:biotin-(acetyl-CoA carboxylase) ligase